MNKKSLDKIFSAYIKNFVLINNTTNNETYKWASILRFQQVFQIDAPDFAAMLKAAKDATENIIDSYTQPFYGLVKLAELEPETVREMFRALYADDSGDLTVRQHKIDSFLRSCDTLLEHHFPGSYLYRNDQRSAMAYLFFHDPENHYLYKATEAKHFADRAGFYDDWGPMSAFKLNVYHRFCDELTAEIEATPALLETHKSRFNDYPTSVHGDLKHHILAFDIIYCLHAYGLYANASDNKATIAERRLYKERKATAQALLKAVQQAEADLQLLREAHKYFIDLAMTHPVVRHKTFGEADVVSVENGRFMLRLRKSGEQKGISLEYAGLVHFDVEDYDVMVAKYSPILHRDRNNNISKHLQSAQAALQPYIEYLD